MKLILIFLSLTLIQACGDANGDTLSPVFESERLSHDVIRLENEEAICYKLASGQGISCAFKYYSR